ncbi:MAG: hypothetical protein JXA23_02740, partial [Bacteroidales bacterium]|nr:hypothetical protein [Bacteroidales bacterium]
VKVNSDLEYDSIYTQPFTYDSLCPHPIISTPVELDISHWPAGMVMFRLAFRGETVATEKVVVE